MPSHMSQAAECMKDERCSALIEIVSKRSEQMACENIEPRSHKKINGKLQ